MDQFRPRLHFTPPTNWMNDPNGLIFHNGIYHLYYQHNPLGDTWASPHWGHAVSADLLHWEDRPVALYPTEPLGSAWSGSVVEAPDGLTAIYTCEAPAPGDGSSHQQQCIAVSNDDGDTFRPHPANPVIPNPGLRDFRDPRVFRYDDSGEWKLVLGAGDRAYIYGSRDLVEWRLLSEFGAGLGPEGAEWECPDLIPFEEDGRRRWVLVVSMGRWPAPSLFGVAYFVGDFDGQTFTCDHVAGDPLHWMDWGHDFYAAQSWYGLGRLEPRELAVAWMGRWSYAEQVPTSPWRGAMSLPRELELRRMADRSYLIQRPVAELGSLRHISRAESIEAPGRFAGVTEVPLEVSLSYAHTHGGELVVALVYEGGETLSVAIDHSRGVIRLDRAAVMDGIPCADHELVAEAPLPRDTRETGELRLVLDTYSVEVFGADGAVSMTDVIFPRGGLAAVDVEATGSVRNLAGAIYPLEPTPVTGRAPA